MDNRVTELLVLMTENYDKQLVLYEKLYKITIVEQAAIEQKDTLRLIELLRLEDELMEQVRTLESMQKESKEMLGNWLPGQQLSMDHLACLTDTRVFVGFKGVLANVASVLGKVERQKDENVQLLSKTLQPLCENPESLVSS